jgi:hypothetical protein
LILEAEGDVLLDREGEDLVIRILEYQANVLRQTVGGVIR